MTTSDQAEKLLRKCVCASEGADVALAVRRLMMVIGPSGSIPHIAQAEANIQPHDLRWFSTLFAQGMQWAHEQYPHVQGPDAVLIGHPNQPITYIGHHLVFPTQTSLASGNGIAVVMIPFNDLHEFLNMHRSGRTDTFTAHNRKHLGAMSAEEFVFLAGIEEFKHAVQRQDATLNARLDDEDRKIALTPYTISSFDPILTDYDFKAREIDVVQDLENGLATFRARRSVDVPPHS